MINFLRDHWKRSSRGQSFVELALALPLILLLLAGLVEVAFFIFSYLNLLDLTREAARFASVRNYRVLQVADASGLPQSACEDNVLHFYYDTACFFVDPDLNPYIPLDPAKFDDVTISVFTVDNNLVTHRWPVDTGGIWSLYGNNYLRDCEGNPSASSPSISNSELESMFLANAPTDRGLVLIQVYMCYDLMLNLPFISNFTPSPFRMHAYTIMPAPEAIPTPTPIGP